MIPLSRLFLAFAAPPLNAPLSELGVDQNIHSFALHAARPRARRRKPAIADEKCFHPTKTDGNGAEPPFPTGTRDDEDELIPAFVMKITQSAHQDMLTFFKSQLPERAGIMIGTDRDDVLVTHFIPDEQGESSRVSFRLHTPSLNQELKRAKEYRMNCKGIIHSHPSGITTPSQGDLAYLERLFAQPGSHGLTQFFMPIFCDGRIFPYVYSHGRIWMAELMLV